MRLCRKGDWLRAGTELPERTSRRRGACPPFGKRRAGLSLLEVLVATAILLASVVLLLELADVGRKHADSAEDKATAQRICQSLLNEILVGARPLATTPEESLADEPGWVWLAEVKPVDLPAKAPLGVLRVTAAHGSIAEGRGEQFTLWRWVRAATPPVGDDSGQPADEGPPPHAVAGGEGP